MACRKKWSPSSPRGLRKGRNLPTTRSMSLSTGRFCGQANHSYLEDGTFVGEAVTVDCFALYIDALAIAFQYDPVSPIHGELYRVSPTRLAALD